MSQRKFEGLREYLNKFPMWVEYHIGEVVDGFYMDDGTPLSDEEKKSMIEEELGKLDRFCELMLSTDKKHQEVEKEIYGPVSGEFYKAVEKFRIEDRKRVERIERRREREDAQQKINEEKNFGDKFYFEKTLSSERKQELAASGYKRLKVSPFGDSGASYYWVKTRYNESREHAFFCYLIESELLKKHVEPRLNVNNGPDVEFWRHRAQYCFEVETGTRLVRAKEQLERKFKYFKESYAGMYILVTSKKLKRKYSKYGTVITRHTLKETIEQLLS